MAQLLEDSSFCEEFIQQCPAAVEVLNLVAQECSPGGSLNHSGYNLVLCSIETESREKCKGSNKMAAFPVIIRPGQTDSLGASLVLA